METSAVSSTFRFRDHQEILENENETESDSSSDVSSVSTDRDDETELDSMTGKGIRRLCMELLEIKEASDEDFHANIFANYSAFVGSKRYGKGINATHVAMQKMLVKDLTDGKYFNLLSEETVESFTDEFQFDESSVTELEAHIRNVSETLDMVLFENRSDEAIEILELELENIRKLQLGDEIPSNLLRLYNDAISERRNVLVLQLTLIAENSRISAPELQKTLVRICRLGDTDLANQLLIKYYHSRIVSGLHNLQSSKTYLQGVYIRELSKFVFSMISQAAKSFLMLHGETSSYSSEFIQWIQEEIEPFAVNFNKYVKSISEISNRLSSAVEAVKFATSYCSLLETQRLVLKPTSMEHLRACMEDIFGQHIDHFKKVISIFTSNDTWILGRYLLSGVLNEGYSYTVVGQQPEYCLLTNSGPKFVTLLQVISQEVTPLAALQMESSVLAGVSNLFIEYIANLEKAITFDVNELEKLDSKVFLADALQQQVSVLANLSTLEHFFFSIVTDIFRFSYGSDPEQTKSDLGGFKKHELEDCLSVIKDSSAQLRTQFFRKLIDRAVSLEICKLAYQDNCDPGSDLFHGLMPSPVFQVLFLELRKINKLSEYSVFEIDWLNKLTKELIDSIFTWVSNNFRENYRELDTNDNLNQFVVDMHFLVEAIKHGEYFSKDPLVPAILMKNAFNSVGLDPFRDIDDDGWAMKAASEAIEKLLAMEKNEVTSNDNVGGNPEEQSDNHSEVTSEIFQGADESPLSIPSSEENTEKAKLKENTELHDLALSSSATKNEDCSADTSATNLTNIDKELEDIESDVEFT